MSRLRAGFTLIELLVVIAVLAVLAAILFPVFTQAREKARATACASNCRQVGMAVIMYIQDHDERLPLTSHSGIEASWLVTVQPYTRSRLLHRCPSDTSTNWDRPLPGQAAVRRSSYATNAYLTPAGGFMALAQIPRPAECVYLAELAEQLTGDHIHPQLWPRPGYTGRVLDPRREVATDRHQGGANYVFVDGHAKWYRFEQTWHPPRRDWYFPGGP